MTYKDDILVASSAGIPWDKFSGRNILVTGATGLIGSCIVEILMSRKDIDYDVYASGRNEQRIHRLFPDYVSSSHFHFLKYNVAEPLVSDVDFHYMIAAASGANPVLYSTDPVGVMKANFMGVDNLLSYGVKHHLEKFVYISSGDVYGEGDGRVFTEDYSGFVDPLNLRSCYTSSKRATETLCISYANQYGTEVCVARPCHTYGPNFSDSDTRVYAQFIRNVLNNEDIIMKSKGEQVRSWCYVVDCALGILYVLLMGQDKNAYNISDSKSVASIREIADIVAEIGNRKVIVNLPSETERRGFNVVEKEILDSSKLMGLGWIPCCDINSGFQHTISFLLQKHKNLITQDNTDEQI